jgi:hypothetical protein
MYIVIFKLEEDPEKWVIQKYNVSLGEAAAAKEDLISCGNVVAAEILLARVL